MNDFECVARHLAELAGKLADDEQQGICHLTEAEEIEQLELLEKYRRGIADRTNGRLSE
jgi:hypothetical protein